ncbi:MAG: AMP-binding protein, partial [Proteobacteria bacterium]|nr:AMP-binding protein [Pseudomonadota bacterium]
MTPPTVIHLLASAAAEAPEAEALVLDDQRLTYREYAACAAALAGVLRGLGAEGGRVATLLPNSLEACIAAFAVHAA